MKKIKIETYLPFEVLDKIKNALYEYGFGKIGNYDCCLNWYEVNSSWRATCGANPYKGKVGSLEKAKEYKLEFICEEERLKLAIDTIKKNHLYEEVCINILPIVTL